MKKSFIRILTVIFMTVPLATDMAAASDESREKVDKALKQLDSELSLRERYINRRQTYADSLRRSLALTERGSRQWLATVAEIGQTYSAFNNDSALVYFTLGLDEARGAGLDEPAANFAVRRAQSLAVGGHLHDALGVLAEIDTTDMSSARRRIYYGATRQLYSYISTSYDHSSASYDFWQNKAVEAQRHLLQTMEEGSTEYALNLAEYHYSRNEYAQSRRLLMALLVKINADSAEYAIACHILAEIARARGDADEYIYYLTQSAISDTRRANLEVTSIQELGGALFEKGATGRAHRYLSLALKNAVESQSSVRMGQISQLMTVVENVHNAHTASWRRTMWVFIIVLTVLVIGLATLLILLNRQLRKAAQMKARLETANKTKEVYMSQFLTLCSVYMDKLKQLCSLTNRKISAGQIDELYKITKSGKFIEEQSREFYSVFDNAFLHIYPDFLRQVNALLRPDCQISLAKGELLNSDLRILAFMRLGIDDANRVAQILNYSVNTIYAYRNKLRNRAISRDTFESDIMAIGG